MIFKQHNRPTPREQFAKRVRHQFGLKRSIAQTVYELHFKRPD
ncbi:hypothetical protein SAMN04488036_11226 [Shimia haliotis]|uniref:Uncharacterized protein n=1 Tax=Shimia haliotis TaxID=1280847 RepID=A0A1I4HCS9_9RHOB|nr:hypothetical protein SAMN04488036_11226 [Shimia haliotis]